VVVSTGVGGGGKVGMLLRWWGLGGEVEELGGEGGRGHGGYVGGRGGVGMVWDVLGGGLVRSSWVIIWLCLVVGSGMGVVSAPYY